MPFLVLLLLAAALAAEGQDYQVLETPVMLGVHMSPPSPATQYINHTSPDVGVEVLHIYQGTAAERINLKIGDVIVAINGGDIGLMDDVRNEVTLAGVGGEVKVDILRDGKKITLSGTVSEWPKHIPHEPLDTEAEQRFRKWQEQRWQRIINTADHLSARIVALEEKPWAKNNERDLVSPEQVAVLRQIPAFRLRLNLDYDSSDRRKKIQARDVAWDARVLIGTVPCPIY
jgi:membrane-associated protease RseP (regulator of RpoE activity)